MFREDADEGGLLYGFYENGSASFDGFHLFILITFMVLLIHIKCSV